MYQVLDLDGHLTEDNIRGGGGGGKVQVLKRGLSSHPFLQLFCNFDYCPLNRGWPLYGGSTVDK